jgi:hypothetical protein
VAAVVVGMRSLEYLTADGMDLRFRLPFPHPLPLRWHSESPATWRRSSKLVVRTQQMVPLRSPSFCEFQRACEGTKCQILTTRLSVTRLTSEIRTCNGHNPKGSFDAGFANSYFWDFGFS